MRIGFVQTKPTYGGKKENIDKACELVKKTASDILVLPELFSTGYLFPSRKEAAEYAESVPDGKTVRLFKALAKKKKCAYVFGMVENKSGKIYNSAVYVTPGGDIYLYRKVHLFYKEPQIFSKGNIRFKPYPFYEYKIGIMICFDYIFPEACRVLALQGTNLICHPSNLVLDYCQKAMQTRSLENRIFTITANRVGVDSNERETLRFTGKSQITDTEGNVVFRAGGTRPMVRSFEVDLDKSYDKKPTELNHIFNDRRPEFYKKLQD
jgi:predicted amidohydrolase